MALTLLQDVPFTSTLGDTTQFQCNGGGYSSATYPLGYASVPSVGTTGYVDIMDGWLRTKIRTTDPDTFGGIRSEVVLPADTIGTEYWYSFQFLIKEEEWEVGTGKIILCQMHPEDSIVGATNFSLYAIRDGLEFRSATNPTASSFAETNTFIGPIQFNKVYTVVIHALWKTDTTGFIEAFVDGVQVHKRANVKTAYTADAPYFKMGVYDGPHLEDFGTKAAYFRNLKRYSGSAGYAELLNDAPRTPNNFVGAM